MISQELRCLQLFKKMCPYLANNQVTQNLIISEINKCPFMKQFSQTPQYPQKIIQKLSNPLNYIGISDLVPSKPASSHFTQALNNLKNQGRYRIFTNILRKSGQFPQATEFMSGKEQEITVWCSNDYLGMGQNPEVISAMKNCLDKHGAGSGGTRNIGGNTNLHVTLQRQLADLHQKEAALVCTSGYVANQCALGVLPSVFPQGVIYFSDQENHASMINGMRKSKANRKDIRVFKHNNLEHLEQLLKKSAFDLEDAQKVKILVFESVYSMSGSIAPLEQMKELASRYGAITYIDEVHGVGLYGETGAGVCEQQGIEMDIISGTLGKAFGVHGGYIAASKDVIDCIRSFAPSFIFTTSLPPVSLAGSLASIRYLKQSKDQREKLHLHSKLMKKRLKQENLPVMDSASHIVPLFIGNPNKCKQVSDILLNEFKIYVQPINYPTVPKGQELLRLSPGPLHTPDKIEYFVQSAKTVWTRLGLTTSFN